MKRFAIFFFSVVTWLHAWPQDVEKAFEYYNTGRYLEAATEFEAALPSIIAEYGESDTANYAYYLTLIAISYDNAQQFKPAERYYLQALHIYEAVNGYNDPFYSVILSNLAELYIYSEQYEKAIALFSEDSKKSKNTIVRIIEKAKEYFNSEKYNEAARTYELALPYFRNEFGEYDTTYYTYFLNLTALSYDRSQQFITAENHYLQAKQIYDSLNCHDDPFYGIILNNLAGLYETMGQYEKALPLYLEALENTKKSHGKEHSSYGTSLNNLASVYSEIGQYDKALQLCEEALENTERSLGRDHSDYGIRLNNLAVLYTTIGKYEKAMPMYVEALENTEKSLGKEHSQYGLCLNNLAELFSTMGQCEKALPMYLEALENTEKSLGKDHTQYGLCLNNLAGLYKTMSQFDTALLLYFEAIENAEVALGKHHYEYGIRLNNIADLFSTMGQYEKALPLFLEALEITERSLGKEHAQYGVCLNNLANLFSTMGQYEEALLLYLEALENTEKSLGKEHSHYGIRLNNLAEFYRAIGQHEEALPLYLEALENTEKSLGKEHQLYGIRLSNLALLYIDIEQYDKALPLYLAALENTEKSIGKEDSQYGICLNNLAGLYRTIGQYDKALPLIIGALENTQRTLGINHSSYGVSLNNLAALYVNLGYYDRALKLRTQAIENNFFNIDQAFTFLPESEKEKFLKTVAHNFKAYMSFFLHYSTQQPSVAGDAVNVELATKGMILNSGIQMRQAIAGSGDSVAMAKFDEWLMNRNVLAMQYSLPISERRSDLAAFEEKTNRLESELSRVSTTFSQQVSIGRIRWQHVREQLQEGECAIEFSSFNYYDGKRWTDSTFYCALVLTKDCEFPHMFFLFEENELYEALPDPTNSSHWDYNLAYHGIRASGTAVFEQGSYRGDKLYELIWRPIDSLLQDKGIETIYFAPSGLLHTISFAAIPTPDAQLLMEKYKLVQLGSTRTVAMQQEPVELKTAVVFGGIDYDVKGEELELIAQQFKENESFVFQYMPYRASDTRHGGFTYLEGSLVEARKVSGLLSEKISTTKISGRDAIEESFKALSGSHSPSVIHIATHGFYFPDTISDKRREQMMFAAIGEERFRISDDPLMRSALVMAGANHGWKGKTLPPGVQDGILTARDVSAMNLANTELVVLSACQTGLGDVKGSEGVTGLQRAFKMAGVRYIIMSLWPVPDKETVEFMEAFYGNWLGGMEIRTAFTATQKQMHERYPNEPFKWAAFVLIE